MLRIIAISILFSVSVLEISGQNSTWIFGWGGSVSFEDGVPVMGSGGPIFSAEGTACVSDIDGNFLFSSDGVFIYDRNGNVMEGGTGLMGHESSTQGVLIAPRPFDTENRFYHVFTAPAQDNLNGTGGLYHSVVDMQQNNGLGQMITEPELLVSNVGEKIHATMHADGNRIWVITHKGNTNEFHAILLSCDGIDSNSTRVSSTGDIVDFYDSYRGAIGALKISPDGKRIAMTHLIETAPNIAGGAKLHLGSFNNITGGVEISDIFYEEGELLQGYGVEFSPNSNFIYWSQMGMTVRRILRFDLLSDNIPATRLEVANATNGQSFAFLQLGPDSKIYAARTNGANYLSRIENPDEQDPSELLFTDIAISFNGLSTLGLPNDWKYSERIIESIEDFEIQLCEGNQAELAATTYSEVLYSWSTGESGNKIVVEKGGVYSVEIIHPCFTQHQNFIVDEIASPNFEISGDTDLCEGEKTEIEILTNSDIIWWDGNNKPSRVFSNQGVFLFDLIEDACVFPQELNINMRELPEIDFRTNRISKCMGKQTILDPDIVYAEQLLWSSGDTLSNTLVTDPGIYSLTAYNSCGETTKTIEVIDEECECSVYIPNAFSPNGDGLNDTFQVVCDCEMSDYTLKIYNRWGQLVFETENPEMGWTAEFDDNGFSSPNSLYSYKLTCLVSKSAFSKWVDKEGSISLVR